VAEKEGADLCAAGGVVVEEKVGEFADEVALDAEEVGEGASALLAGQGVVQELGEAFQETLDLEGVCRGFGVVGEGLLLAAA